MLVVGVMFIKVGIVVVTGFTPDYRMLPPSLPKLAERLDDYVEIDGLKQRVTADNLNGKSVIVSKDNAGLHPLMRGLPDSIKATAPEDVDYVIWIETEHLPNPDFEVSLASKPTPEEIAAWSSTSHPAGSGIPMKTAGELDFGTPWLSGQQCIYVDDKMVKGCEVLFSDKGDILLSGKRLAGVVAPVAWDEALEWIEQVIKP